MATVRAPELDQGQLARAVEFRISEGRAAVRPCGQEELEVWRDNRGAVSAYGFIADGLAWIELPGVASFRLDPADWAVTAFAKRKLSREALREHYHHAVLPIALQYFGYEVLHASAVCAAGGAVAFCAVSETGKSTLAAAFDARGYTIAADDAVALEVDDDGGAIRMLRIPFRPRYQCSAANAGATSRCIGGDAHGGEFLLQWLGALCVVERVEHAADEVSIDRLAPARALVALLPHAHCFSLRDAERRRLMMRRYLEICARIPVFAVKFETGLERLPRILDAIEGAVPGFHRS